MSPYTIVLRKIDSCSRKKAAKKSAKTVGKDSWKRQLEKTVGKDSWKRQSGGESGGLHSLYRQKDNRIQAGSL